MLRVAKRRSDLDKRQQNKGTLGSAGMGNDESLLREDALSVIEQVQVDHARRVAMLRVEPSKPALQRLQACEQESRRQRRFATTDRVEKIGLLAVVHRATAIERREAFDFDVSVCAQGVARGCDMRVLVAEVATEGEEHGRMPHPSFKDAPRMVAKTCRAEICRAKICRAKICRKDMPQRYAAKICRKDMPKGRFELPAY